MERDEIYESLRWANPSEIERLHLRNNFYGVEWANPRSVTEKFFIPDMELGFIELCRHTPEENLQNRRELRASLLEMYLENESEELKAAGEWHFFKGPGCVEEPETEVEICVRIPKGIEKDAKLPCVVEAVGGGMYCASSHEFFMHELAARSRTLNAVVVSFNYRVCVEAEYPASINDGHAVYQWVLDHADEINVDKERIVIYGFSGGAQLALCMGFRLKRYGIKPRGIVVENPVTDDVVRGQSGTISGYSPEYDNVGVWDYNCVRLVMQNWLGKHFADPRLPAEAIPNRATVEDCKGYPPVWFTAIGELDPMRDSTLELLRKFHLANVACDYHVVMGTNHGMLATKLITIENRERTGTEWKENRMIYYPQKAIH